MHDIRSFSNLFSLRFKIHLVVDSRCLILFASAGLLICELLALHAERVNEEHQFVVTSTTHEGVVF